MARDKINIGKELLEIGTAKAKLWGTVIAGIVSAPSRRREMAEARRVGEQMKQKFQLLGAYYTETDPSKKAELEKKLIELNLLDAARPVTSVQQESNIESEKTTERVVDESEVPEKVRTHLTAEEQEEKLLEAIASANDAAKRAELIKQLKALK